MPSLPYGCTVTHKNPISSLDRWWPGGAEELEGVMGYFVNTVALRCDLSESLTGEAFLKHVRRLVVDAHEHQELPFEEVIESLSAHRAQSHAPLFNVMMVCEDDPISTFNLRALEVSHLPWEPTSAEFDLVFMLVNKGQGLELGMLYDATIFDESTITRMLGQLERLLEEFITQPDARLEHLSWLTAEERRQMLIAWNQPNTSLPAVSGIHSSSKHRSNERHSQPPSCAEIELSPIRN